MANTKRFICLHEIAGMTLCITMLSVMPSTAWSLDIPATKKSIDKLLTQSYPQLDVLYKDLHAQPELGFQEVKTAARLAKEMRALGFEVTEQIGKTGIVAIYKNGKGPTVMVRTDLDGLPMEEQTGLPYASRAKALYNGTETFVMHSCGHDIHMSVWVGTAKMLVTMKDQWRGTLMFIGQPAEETVRGARAMLDDGLFTRFGKPDFGFALHAMPAAYDEVLYRAGAITSNGSGMEIKFIGRGGHGSNPSDTIDPVMMAGRFIVDVQSVISREKDPAAFGVVTVGAVQGGSAGNIIPDSVVVRGTVRSQSDEVHQKLFDGIRRTANAVATMAGAAPPEITLGGGVKSVMNDQTLTMRTAAVFTTAFGNKARQMPAPWSGGEDYTDFIVAGVPSVFFGIGIYDPARITEAQAKKVPVPANHSPFFAPVPEPAIKTGVTAMSLAVMNAMSTR